MTTQDIEATSVGEPRLSHQRQRALPASSLVPTRPRRDRRLLIVGVLVVLLGGILGATAARMITAQTDVLTLTRDVPAGNVLTSQDLSVVAINTDSRVTSIPASERSAVVGKTVQAPLVAGSVLTWRELGTGSGFTAGDAIVSLPLGEGRLPARGLRPGQTVLLVTTPTANGTPSSSASPTDSIRSGVVATVTEVGATNPGTSVTVVDVTVGVQTGAELAQLAATGNLSLLLLPAGR